MVSLDHCQRGLVSRQSYYPDSLYPVIRILLLLLPLALSVLHASGYGPICEWHDDPTTTMSIHWVADSNDERPGGDWKLGAAGFGYRDDDDHTVLDAMRGKYRSLYIRWSYEVLAKAPRGAGQTIGKEMAGALPELDETTCRGHARGARPGNFAPRSAPWP